MKKAFENIKIERPVIENNTLNLRFKDEIDFELKEIYWSEDSNQLSFHFSNDSVIKNSNGLIINLEENNYDLFKVYYLIGKSDKGVPVRFTYDEINSLTPPECHFTVLKNDVTDTIIDLWLNPWGNIGIQRLPQHILDTERKQLPINCTITKFEVTSEVITSKIILNYDISKLDLTNSEIRPVFISVNRDKTELSRIHDYSVKKNNDEVMIDLLIGNVINLKEKQLYSFGILISQENQKYILLVNQVSEEVFEIIHPFTDVKFLFKKNIVHIGWFNKEGIIFSRLTTNDLIEKQKLKFEGKYKFPTIEDEEIKQELKQSYLEFKQGWTSQSAFHRF